MSNEKTETREQKIKRLTKMYLDRGLLQNQDSVVRKLHEGNEEWFDDCVNLYPNSSEMDAAQVIEWMDDNDKDLDFYDWPKDKEEIIAFMNSDSIDQDSDGNYIDFNDSTYDQLVSIYCAHIDDSGSMDFEIDAMREWVSDNAEMAEVLSWWLVDEWSANQLEAIGEVVYREFGSHWWGRTTYGQMVIQDGVWQQIAAKFADIG